MARGKGKNGKANRELEGAHEFAGEDTEKAALDKIAAAREASETEAAQDRGDNGGPVLDAAAQRRAVNELTAETIALEELATKRAEIRGRISSIKKVLEKCGGDWDVVQDKVKIDRLVAKGQTGEYVTHQRRLGELMRQMESPLHTQWGLFPELPEDKHEGENAKPGMDAELQGQHAYREGAKLTDNPFHAATDTERHNDWHRGWVNAQNATAREMGPSEGEGQATH